MYNFLFTKVPFLFVISGLLFVSSCKDDIDLAGSYKETPVVFCLLNQAESIHYVKLTRTFSANSSSLTTAQIADSSYYQNATVKIDEVIVNGAGVPVITRSWNLNDTLVPNKDSGLFYGPDQKMYYFTTPDGAPLYEDAVYKLTISVNNGEYQVTGETKLVTGVSLIASSAPFKFRVTQSGVEINGIQSIKGIVGNSKVLNTSIDIAIREYMGSASTTKIITWNLGDRSGADLGGNDETWLASGEVFYDLINKNCTDDASITKRQLLYLDVKVTGGSSELEKYILINQPSSGLSQSKPSFTNLLVSDGRKAIGLFSARQTFTGRKFEYNFNPINPSLRSIDAISMKYLCLGQLTSTKLFCTTNPSISDVLFFCN